MRGKPGGGSRAAALLELAAASARAWLVAPDRERFISKLSKGRDPMLPAPAFVLSRNFALRLWQWVSFHVLDPLVTLFPPFLPVVNGVRVHGLTC